MKNDLSITHFSDQIPVDIMLLIKLVVVAIYITVDRIF